VWFRWGDGEVFHMISHYYLQRTELRTQRHQAPAASYFAEKGIDVSLDMCADIGDLCLSEVESAKPSAAFMANVVVDKKEKALRRMQAEANAKRKAQEDQAQE
jgi:hypothetical protein